MYSCGLVNCNYVAIRESHNRAQQEYSGGYTLKCDNEGVTVTCHKMTFFKFE